jgi:hypothetical protein
LRNKTSTKSDEWQMTAGNILKGHDVCKGHLERAHNHNSWMMDKRVSAYLMRITSPEIGSQLLL